MSESTKLVMLRRTFAVAVAAALLIAGAALIQAEDETPKAETEPSKLHDDLIGAWTLAEAPVGRQAVNPRRLKFFGRKHWAISQSDQDGRVQGHHGGTYILDGDTYVETVEFAMGDTTHIIGQKFKFKIKVEGDKYTQTGIGNHFDEVWKRGQ